MFNLQNEDIVSGPHKGPFQGFEGQKWVSGPGEGPLCPHKDDTKCLCVNGCRSNENLLQRLRFGEDTMAQRPTLSIFLFH